MPTETEMVLARAETILAQCVVAAGTASAAASLVGGAAPVNSPVFTGSPKAPTKSFGDNSTNLATTAYVDGQKGAASGIASLDPTGHIPTAELPASVLGGLTFKGLWNANDNSPTLQSGQGTTGWFYVVNVEGTTSLDGISNWAVGDWAVFQTSTWGRVPATQAPISGLELTALAPLAAHTFVANKTASPASPTAVSAADATAELSLFGGDAGGGGTKGLVPAPGAGDAAAGKFLKASGGFEVPPGADLSGYALLNSPSFSGTPTAPTKARDTNSTGLATMEFVLSQLTDAGDSNPAANGTAAKGSSTHGSRADHVHPTDTSRAPINAPAFTGNPTATTQSQGDNSTKLATTAYVDTAAVIKQLATQAEAEAGTDNTKGMTPLRVAQEITAKTPLATQGEAEAGTDNTKHMTPLRVAQAIDAQASVPIIATPMQVKTTTGSQTVTIPANATKCKVTLVGGSGGISTGCAGGGGTCIKLLTGLTPGLTFNLYVAPTSNGNGENTVLSSGSQSIDTLTASGGSNSGQGGDATGGDVNIPGGWGGYFPSVPIYIGGSSTHGVGWVGNVVGDGRGYGGAPSGPGQRSGTQGIAIFEWLP